MTSEGLGGMFEGDFADTCTKNVRSSSLWDKRTVKRAQTVSEDPHWLEWKFNRISSHKFWLYFSHYSSAICNFFATHGCVVATFCMSGLVVLQLLMSAIVHMHSGQNGLSFLWWISGRTLGPIADRAGDAGKTWPFLVFWINPAFDKIVLFSLKTG